MAGDGLEKGLGHEDGVRAGPSHRRRQYSEELEGKEGHAFLRPPFALGNMR